MQKNSIRTVSAMDIQHVNGGIVNGTDLEKFYSFITSPTVTLKVIAVETFLVAAFAFATFQYRSSSHECKKQRGNDKDNYKLANAIIKVICEHPTENIICTNINNKIKNN